MTTIGILTFRSGPREAMPPMRLRGLAAEAVLQGADLAIMDSFCANADEGWIEVERWTGGAWQRTRSDLPDVVIIVGGPRNGMHEAVDAWVRASRPFIADKGIGKQDLDSLLTGTEWQPYLIPGAMVDARQPRDSIAAFMREHDGAVIKRSDGQRGVGLLFAMREDAPDGQWVLRQDRRVLAGELETIAGAAADRIAGRLRYRSYVMQRLIRSRAADGRAADLRVHVQRRGDGAFDVTRAYVRLAEHGMPLANTSRGGYQGPLEGFLAQRQRRDPETLAAEARSVALGIARHFDASRDRPLSELGVDLLIDEDDRLWLVELNALPETRWHEHERAIHAIGYALSLVRR